MHSNFLCGLSFVVALLIMNTALAADPSQLNVDVADSWSRLVLKGVDTEFPNKLTLKYSNAEQIRRPRDHFPAFFGCFDWHSSVHGHWVLVKLLKDYPEMESASRVRQVLRAHLSAKNLQQEADFFALDEQKSFERMYGWAWLFRLVIELDGWDDEDGRQWRENLRPLETVLLQRVEAYLPLLTFPIRTGQHPDTGFALGQILDYARATNKNSLEKQVLERAKAFYAGDRDYPVEYEPSGHDFFSSCWNEADLMRRVLSQSEFETWLGAFVPELERHLKETILPVKVSDVTDGKLVHLAGLNLNRAWCLQSVASSLSTEHPLRASLLASASEHLTAGIAYVNSGNYEGDHWLATFALYAAAKVGVGNTGASNTGASNTGVRE
ncbi:MAG: DUF2891 domain-containing protein [Planctomycetota bacterium]